MTTPATPAGPDRRGRRVRIGASAWFAAFRDPGIQVLVVFALLAVGAAGMLVLGWRGVARTPYVPFQLPWLLSSSLAGLGVLGFVLGAWSIHLGRRQDAAHRAASEQLVRDAAELAEWLRSSGALRRRR